MKNDLLAQLPSLGIHALVAPSTACLDPEKSQHYWQIRYSHSLDPILEEVLLPYPLRVTLKEQLNRLKLTPKTLQNLQNHLTGLEVEHDFMRCDRQERIASLRTALERLVYFLLTQSPTESRYDELIGNTLAQLSIEEGERCLNQLETLLKKLEGEVFLFNQLAYYRLEIVQAFCKKNGIDEAIFGDFAQHIGFTIFPEKKLASHSLVDTPPPPELPETLQKKFLTYIKENYNNTNIIDSLSTQIAHFAAEQEKSGRDAAHFSQHAIYPLLNLSNHTPLFFIDDNSGISDSKKVEPNDLLQFALIETLSAKNIINPERCIIKPATSDQKILFCRLIENESTQNKILFAEKFTESTFTNINWIPFYPYINDPQFYQLLDRSFVADLLNELTFSFDAKMFRYFYRQGIYLKKGQLNHLNFSDVQKPIFTPEQFRMLEFIRPCFNATQFVAFCHAKKEQILQIPCHIVVNNQKEWNLILNTLSCYLPKGQHACHQVAKYPCLHIVNNSPYVQRKILDRREVIEIKISKNKARIKSLFDNSDIFFKMTALLVSSNIVISFGFYLLGVGAMSFIEWCTITLIVMVPTCCPFLLLAGLICVGLACAFISYTDYLQTKLDQIQQQPLEPSSHHQAKTFESVFAGYVFPTEATLSDEDIIAAQKNNLKMHKTVSSAANKSSTYANKQIRFMPAVPEKTAALDDKNTSHNNMDSYHLRLNFQCRLA